MISVQECLALPLDCCAFELSNMMGSAARRFWNGSRSKVEFMVLRRKDFGGIESLASSNEQRC